MVDLETVVDGDELDFLQVTIVKHVTYTGSRYAEQILTDWGQLHRHIVKVMPREYKRALAEQAKKKLDEMKIGIETIVVTGTAANVAAEGATAAR
jgi:glutamate synthase domain-containing protein 3